MTIGIPRSAWDFRKKTYRIPGIFIPASLRREAGLAHLLEHLSHLRVLAQQIVHFLHAGAGAAGDALAAAAVDDFVMQALVLASSN